jgi:formylmethanofuran dehydrogenase subunit E
LDPLKLDAWSEIKSWFFRQKPKEEQDSQLLMEQIKEAGASICSLQQVKISPHFLKKQHGAGFAICPRCEESYPIADGVTCLGCQGEVPYMASQIPYKAGATHEEGSRK